MPQLQYVIGGIAAVALWVLLTINFSCRGFHLLDERKLYEHYVPVVHDAQVRFS